MYSFCNSLFGLFHHHIIRCEITDDRCFASVCRDVVAADIPPNLRFPIVRRLRPLPLVLRRFSSFGRSSIYSGDCSMMRMRCDRPVVIRGFGVSGSMGCDPVSELQVCVVFIQVHYSAVIERWLIGCSAATESLRLGIDMTSDVYEAEKSRTRQKG